MIFNEGTESEYYVSITARKSPDKNKFWVHHFEAIKNVSDSPADTKNGVKTGYTIADSNSTITQESSSVKENIFDTQNQARRILLPDGSEFIDSKKRNAELTSGEERINSDTKRTPIGSTFSRYTIPQEFFICQGKHSRHASPSTQTKKRELP